MKIVDSAGMRMVEAAAIAAGTAEFTLMQRAGSAAAKVISGLMKKWDFSRIVFLCGGGNNGGDALVAAALLSGKFPIAVFALRPLEQLHGAAAEAAAMLPESVKSRIYGDLDVIGLRNGDLVVDGLLGIGLRGKVRGPVAEIIAAVNNSGLPVVALDVPSGMDSDTGDGRCPGGGAMRAYHTITFGLPKKGLFSPPGMEFAGCLSVADIGLGECGDSCGEAYTAKEAAAALPCCPFEAHKNSRGRLLVMAGSRSYPGAAKLATCAGLRGGAGIVRTMFPSGSGIVLPAAAIPIELRCGDSGGFTEAADWSEFPSDALVAGPGWGSGVPAEVLEQVLRFPGKLLLDADALNLLSRHPKLWVKRSDVVLTPHPEEAARLACAFGIPMELPRHELAAELSGHTGAVVVLKGPRTVVARDMGCFTLNVTGGPDLATAGSGDVLSGLIGALLSRGMEPLAAAQLGVFVHGAAGDRCGRGCIADDLPQVVSQVMSELAFRLLD